VTPLTNDANNQTLRQFAPLSDDRLLQLVNGMFTRSSKRPANFQQMYPNTRANAGRLLNRVNTL